MITALQLQSNRQAILSLIPAKIRNRIAHRPTVLKIANNISWLMLDKVLRMTVGLVIGVWIARHLGPESFGQLSFALAFASLFAPIASLGLKNIIVRDLAQKPQDAGVILGTAVSMMMIAGLATIVLIAVSISFLRPADNFIGTLVILVGLASVFRFADVIVYWFESQVQSKYTVWIACSILLFFAALKAYLIFVQAPLIAFASLVSAESMLLAVGLFLIYRSSVGNFSQWIASFDRAVGLLKQTWPLIISSLALIMQARIDQVMLGDMLGDEEVGHYSAAMRLVEAMAFAPVIIASTLAPSLAQAKTVSEQLYISRLEDFYRIIFITSCATSIALFLLGKWLVLMTFGPAYERAGELLPLFSIRLFFTAIGLVRSQYITNEGLFRYALITSVVGASVNVALNAVLIPDFKSEGALIATILSWFITLMLIDAFFQPARRNLFSMLVACITVHKLLLRLLPRR